MNNNKGYRSKKSILLCIDVVAIVFSFALAIAIRFRFLVASLGSHLVLTTYIPFFVVVLIAYIGITLLRTEIRIDRMSKKEIIEMTIMQQMILTALYIAVFFVLHRADAISRIVVGLIFIFCVAFCGIGRLFYYEYCRRNRAEVQNTAEIKADYKEEAEEDNKVKHVYIVGDREIIGSTPRNPVIMRDG
ncbi:MAG: hypothetical protein J6M92_03285 [Oribacterium sp.]|nr:hypothetical protein [Oribacterium sp.]